MMLLPAALLTCFASLAACSSKGHDATGSTEDDLTTWESAIAGRPAWATESRLREQLGDDEQVSVQVHLKLRNEKQADAELLAVSDPESPAYGKYLTNEDFAAKYAPTEADVAAVRAHLEKHGLTVNHVPDSRLFVTATGSHAQVSRAFATKLGRYDVNGTLRRAPVGNARMPRAVAQKVSSTLGLIESPKYAPKSVRLGGIKRADISKLSSKQPLATSAAEPKCSEWFGQYVNTTNPPFGGGYPDQVPYIPCGYSPGQLRQAYGLSGAIRRGNDGTGVKIAIIDAYQSPTLLKDAQTYAAMHDPDYPLLDSQFSAQMAPGNPSQPDPGWYAEQTLDVEAVHSIAPGANIVYVGAQSPTDLDLVAALNMIVEGNLASIVSNSYGSPEGTANDFIVWKAATTHAGLKGIGVYFSSGDSGDEADRMGIAVADFPASLPTVTAVGGTSLGLGQTNQRLFEAGWETTASFLTQGVAAADAGADAAAPPPVWDPPAPGFFAFGAGGGTSQAFEQPAWQVGVVPDAIANIPGVPGRAVPDVGMLADPLTGFVIGMTGEDGSWSEGATGGTSLACPLFAATVALAQQNSHKPIGFANPRLYKKRADAMRDIVPNATPQAVTLPGGIIATIDYPGLTIKTAAGWDNVTGLGAPDGENFIKAMKAGSAAEDQ